MLLPSSINTSFLVHRFAFAIYPNIGQLRTSKTTKHPVHSINYIILKFIMAPSAVEVNPTTLIYDLKAKARDVVSKRTAPAKLIKPLYDLPELLTSLSPSISLLVLARNSQGPTSPNGSRLLMLMSSFGTSRSLVGFSILCFQFRYYASFRINQHYSGLKLVVQLGCQV